MNAVVTKEKSFLQKKYLGEVRPFLSEKHKIGNPHCVPYIEKIVVAMRFGKDGGDKKAIEAAISELMLITGQKPAISVAKKSISGFKLREGQTSGAYCTLRKTMAYEFLERLTYLALPRIRDFRGYSSKSFDKGMNLSIGIKEHLVFQELNYDLIHKSRGLDITIVIKNATTKQMAIDLLRKLNFPIKN